MTDSEPMNSDALQLLREFRAGVPAPDDETRRRIYAYATGGGSKSSARHPGWGTTHLRFPATPRLRWRLALSGAVLVCAAVGAVITTNIIGRSGGSSLPRIGARTQPSGASRGLPGFLPLQVAFTRSGQTLTSIAVSVKSSTADATLQLQVLHSDASQPQQATNDPAQSQVVFRQQMPLTNTGSTAADGSLSEWSGALSPSDWTGGCEAGLYTIKADVVPSGSSFDNPPAGSSNAETAWFSCTG
jgi:hypothetical protein